jgi:putative transposase
MPRASRHFLPGYVWHITHRCHKKEFLLKFRRDRHRWLQWLFEAKKRYGLSVLNYTVTSNHVHLIVKGDRDRETIPKSIQLIAGRTGQEYNLRKKRKGAYWEDRYHATAVETDSHLIQCLVYVDLNMVRAGVVKHPEEWPFSGYNEILEPRQRYGLIDFDGLRELFNFRSISELANAYRGWVEGSMKEGRFSRDGKWTASIAVGKKEFVEKVKERLGARAQGREVRAAAGAYVLNDPEAPYTANFGGENDVLRFQNAHLWNVYNEISNG